MLERLVTPAEWAAIKATRAAAAAELAAAAPVEAPLPGELVEARGGRHRAA